MAGPVAGAGLLRPTLRADRRLMEGQVTWVIEDPLRSRFYRLGEVEYAFVSAFDGDLEATLERVNARHPEAALDADDAQRILDWLTREGLLAGASHEESPPAPALPRWLNPLVIRLPLLNPDPWLSRHRWLIALLTGRVAVLAWCAVVGSALLAAVVHADALASAGRGVFYPGNWLGLLLVWVLAKVAHEFAHGLTCKRFGGEVYEAGVILVLFMPLGYVDATSSWRFRRRRERALVALAGMAAELFLAALALWAWLVLPAGIGQTLAYNMIIIAGVSTLLFNANPLMRFDGYFALSDLLDIPNLYGAGQRQVDWLWRRHVLGLALPAPVLPGGRVRLVRLYGLAAMAWRWTVIVALLFAAAQLFRGLGIVLATLAAAGLVLGIARRARPLWQALPPRQRGLAAARGALCIGGLAALAALVSFRPAITAPAIVEATGLESVRVSSAGFVRRVLVHPGESVQQGQLLALLENPGLALAADLLAIDLRAARLRERSLRAAGDLAAAREAAGQVAQLEREAADAARRVVELQVHAPRDGVVDADSPDALQGRYLETGDELLAVVGGAGRRLRVSIGERDAAQCAGRSARLRLPGRAVVEVTLADQVPRASARVDEAVLALAATHGGELPVRAREGGAGLEFMTPRVDFHATLPAGLAARARSGEVGRVLLEAGRQSLLAWMYQRTQAWFEHLLQPRRQG